MKLLREPLFHFLLGGALLFGVHAWLNRDAGGAGGDDRIVLLSDRELTWIVETSTRQWQRAPTESELAGLAADYLREELLAREARALELDRDDTIVRRRLAQKMNFVLEGTARLGEPTEAELHALFDARREQFVAPARSSFEQVYFSPEKRGAQAGADARRALTRLARNGPSTPWSALGDGSLLPAEMTDADEAAVAGQFGPEFATAVGALAPGAWQGPIASVYGLHLVRVTARQEARRQPYDEVRPALVDAWRRERERLAKDAYFGGLLRKYDVQVTGSLRPLLEPALAAMRGTVEEREAEAPAGASQ